MASRAERINRLRELVKENPDWGKDRLNRELRSELGQGLQRKYVGEVKREIVYAHPTIEEKRYQILRFKDGFLPTEARYLSNFPVYSDAMKAYRADRRHYRREAELEGISLRNQNRLLKAEYIMAGAITKGKPDPIARFRKFLEERQYPKEAERVRRPRGPGSYTQQLAIKQLQDYYHFPETMARDMVMGKGARAPMSDDTLKNVFTSGGFIEGFKELDNWIRLMESPPYNWTSKTWQSFWRKLQRKDPSFSPWDFVRDYVYVKPKLQKKQYTEAKKRRAERSRGRVQQTFKTIKSYKKVKDARISRDKRGDR